MSSMLRSLASILEPLCHVLPVDNIPDGLDVVRADILVLKVVGVFPYINTQKWNKT